MNVIRSMIMALSMYTKLPMPKVEWKDENMKYAMCFFPLAGLLVAFMTVVVGIGFHALGFHRFFQCIAMIPGTSRSMSTILGGRLMGLGRKTAAEYSFFAAVPVLLLASVYDLYKGWGTLQRSDVMPYAIGLVVSFFVARVAIRFLMKLISHHTLEAFGWYRSSEPEASRCSLVRCAEF